MDAGFSISIQVQLECPCDKTVWVVPFQADVRCELCDQAMMIDAPTWRAYIEPAVLDGPDLPDGECREVAIGNGKVVFDRVGVECAECHAIIEQDVIAAALATGGGACPGCTTAFRTRPVPPELAAAFPAVSHLVEAFDFHVWHVPERRAHVQRTATYTWGAIDAATCDRDGNLYLMNRDAVACLAPDGTTRWVRTQLALDYEPRIAIAADGSVLLWARTRVEAMRLSGVDGTRLDSIGGLPSPHATAHSLALGKCRGLATDPDGSIVFINCRRLLRCAADGTGIATWPPHKAGLFGRTVTEKLRPLAMDDTECVSVSALKDYPTIVEEGHVLIDAAGRLYIGNWGHVACFDRTGKRVYVTPTNAHLGGVDASGRIYYFRDAGPHRYAIWRLSPTGEPAIHIPDLEGGVLAVAPDGTVFVANSESKLRRYAPDGTPRS